MDPREYDWQMGDLADQKYAGPGGDSKSIAAALKDWWTEQPSWLEKAKAENQKTLEAYNFGGMREVARQVAGSTAAAEDLVGGFGGNIKGIGGKLAAPGALAALDEYRPPFYSAVEQAVQGAKQTTAPGQQWAGYLRNQPGVKPEEVETLKLGDLFSQTGAVSRQSLLDQIAANRVNVGEVVKGDKYYVSDRQGIIRRENLNHNEARALADELGGNAELMSDQMPTKFSQYTLPGGENYREMLLTLPRKVPAGEARLDQINRRLDEISQYRAQYHADHPELRHEYDQLVAERGPLMKEFLTASEQQYKSGHWDEPNVLAHVRTNDRMIDGKKTLFVEEVQSDWHQAGKRKGYAGEQPSAIPSFKPEDLKIEHTEHQYVGTSPDGRKQVVGKGTVGSEDEAREYLARYMNKMAAEKNMTALEEHRSRVPDAPFKTTWPDLAMKRVIREAAEKGYDKVAWTPGSVQADRYDLSKHIDKISYDGQRLWAWKKGDQGQPVINKRVTPEELADTIGKDAAERLMQQPERKQASFAPGEPRSYRTLEGADLKIGGEGMKGFYDEILPATVNKLVKKHGGRVVEADMRGHQYRGYESFVAGEGPLGGPALFGVDKDGKQTLIRQDFAGNKEMAIKMADQLNAGGSSQKVHSIDITPALRAAAMKGFPLFTAGGIVAGGALGDLARQDQYQ